MIEVNNLVKRFGNHVVLNNVTEKISKGEKVVIIGPSGSGKSTFLRCLNLLEVPTSGHILFEGTDITDKNTNIDVLRRKMGMVFQHFNLFPHLTVLQNITIAPIRVLGMDRPAARSLGLELLSQMGLENKAKAYPCELSGGQQQRVSIARALALQPKVLFFDEPTSALDPELTGEILKVIKSLAEKKMTMVIVTHEMAFARDVADKVLFMDQGVVVEQGTPEFVFGQSENERLQTFLARFSG